MVRLTPAQRSLLTHLQPLDPEQFYPSSTMRHRDLKNPGPMLARMAERGLVEPGELTPQGRCYRITPYGRKALS